MHIIKTLLDLHVLAQEGDLSPAMAEYFEQELLLLHGSLEPEVPMGQFSLEIHGPIAVLNPGEENLTGIGLYGTIRDLMVEWVSRKAIGNQEWYTIYVLADNDYMLQIYVPFDGLSPDLAEWLSEQAEEEEQCIGSLPIRQPF